VRSAWLSGLIRRALLASGIVLGVAAPGLTLAASASADDLPAGLVWVVRAPAHDSVTLYRVTASGAVERHDLAYAVNAIGCATNGSVYGLATDHDGVPISGAPHVVQIAPTGTVTDLGAVDTGALRYPLATGYAATASTGPGSGVTLLVGTATDLRPVRVVPGPPALLASRTLPDLPFIGDWDTDPRTGDLYTVVATTGTAQLLRLASADLSPTLTALPGLPGGSAYGGVALTADRVLYAVYNRDDAPSTLYRVPLDHPEQARAVTDVGPAISSDATMCPPPPVPAVPVPAAVTGAPAPRAAITVPALPSPKPWGIPVPVRPPVASLSPAASAPPRRPLTMSRHRPPVRRPSLVGPKFIPIMAGTMVAVVTVLRLTRSHRTRR
jgi:hypothetical protein